MHENRSKWNRALNHVLNAGRWIKLGLLGICLLALLATPLLPVQAQAANVEQVPPVSGGTTWSWYSSGPYSGNLPTAADVCKQYNLQFTNTGLYTYAGTVPNCCGYAAAGYLDCTFTNISTGQVVTSGTAVPYSNAVCPVPAVNPTVPYQYNPVTGMCERSGQNSTCAPPSAVVGFVCVAPPTNCPANTTPYVNSSGAGCACNAPNRINSKGACTACPIDPLPEPPPFPDSDKCSQTLEKNGGLLPHGSTVCPGYKEDKNDLVANCVASKLGAVVSSVRYSGPTATYRTNEYQLHLKQLWDAVDKMGQYIVSYGSNFQNSICPQEYHDIMAEWNKHGLASTPTEKAGSHGESRAIDISGRVIFALGEMVKTNTLTIVQVDRGRRVKVPLKNIGIEEYINSPTTLACNDALAYCAKLPPPPAGQSSTCIQWGGNFKKSERDVVHFQLRQ